MSIAKFTINDENYVLTPLYNVIDNKNITSNYQHWFNDKEVTKYNSHGIFPFNPIDGIKDYLKDPSRIVWAICAPDDDSEYLHIGNIALQNINLINRSAEIACVIGEVDYWGKGIMTKALSILIEHGFKKLDPY